MMELLSKPCSFTWLLRFNYSETLELWSLNPRCYPSITFEFFVKCYIIKHIFIVISAQTANKNALAEKYKQCTCTLWVVHVSNLVSLSSTVLDNVCYIQEGTIYNKQWLEEWRILFLPASLNWPSRICFSNNNIYINIDNNIKEIKGILIPFQPKIHNTL